MSYQTLDEIPEKIVKGDYVAWTEYHADYLPADGWVLSYRFVRSGDQQEIDGSDNGDGSHLIEIDGTASAAFDVGVYRWQAQVDDGTDRVTVGRGRVEILADFESETGGYDARDHVEKVLDALEAVLEGKASSDQLNYSIAGRSLTHYTPEELRAWRRYYKDELKALIAAERRDQGKASGRQIHVRFD